jgi:hypothetical protein
MGQDHFIPEASGGAVALVILGSCSVVATYLLRSLFWYTIFSFAAKALRQQIAAVVTGTPSTTLGFPTAFVALDAVLPGGGIPAGRITELLAPLGLGKTTLGRSLVAATITAERD